MSDLRGRILTALSEHLDDCPSVDGYPIPTWEMAGETHYRIVDAALDLDAVIDIVLTVLDFRKELRCGEVIGVDDPIDPDTHFSGQHRYITGWIG